MVTNWTKTAQIAKSQSQRSEISDPPFLALLDFLAFFPCCAFPCFLGIFSFFSKDFGGLVWPENRCLYQGSPCFKNLLMPLFLMGCFPVDFQEVKRPFRTKSMKHPIKIGKRPINEGKRPIKAKVLVGVSVGCLMGCFRAPPPWRKTAPLKRPIKRSMIVFWNPQRQGGSGIAKRIARFEIAEHQQIATRIASNLLSYLYSLIHTNKWG